jgi:hypothetical protein
MAARVLVITGACAAAAIVIVKVSVSLPPALVAVKVTVVLPAAVGVPLITPVLVLMDSPAGSEVAAKLVGVLVAVIV